MKGFLNGDEFTDVKFLVLIMYFLLGGKVGSLDRIIVSNVQKQNIENDR